jgi:RNA polymerase sigma-70 factor (ECF subfamily)
MHALTLRPTDSDEMWLGNFHAGDRAVMEEVYREHFAIVEQSVGRILQGANRDTVVHELFLRLLANAPMRRSFTGGSLSGWLRTVARNLALDFQRRQRRETGEPIADERDPSQFAERMEARVLIDRFRSEVLPAKWLPVFEARFLRELDQREAARSIGMSRTTLAYQELRIRALLRKFLLDEEEAP